MPPIPPLTRSEDFPGATNYTYLNAANVALMYGGAEKATAAWQQDVARNGSIHFDEAAEQSVFEDLHVAAARLVHSNPEHIAVGSSATELWSSLAWAVAPESETNVVSTNEAFPSTLYPWSRVASRTGCEIRLARSEDGVVPEEKLHELVDEQTSVVCVSHVEYGTGQVYDLSRLAARAHAHGAILVVDATQSAGAIPLDAPGMGIDALVTGAYKWLCGPFGAAVMYVAPHLYRDMEPGLVGFRSHKNMWDLRADRLELPDTAQRFEYSTMAFGCAVGLAKSIEFLLELGIDRIHEYDLLLVDQLVDGLEALGGNILTPKAVRDRSPIVAVRFPNKGSADLVAELKSNQIHVSARGDSIRISPHLYNEPSEIEHALATLKTLLN